MISRDSLRDPPGIGYQRAPEPHDIAAAPELAILQAVDDVLDTALAAVVAANPSLADDPFEPDWDCRDSVSPQLYAADALLYVAHALRCAVDRYRCAVQLSTPRR